MPKKRAIIAQEAGDDLKSSSRLDGQPNAIVGAVMRVGELVGIRMNKRKSATPRIRRLKSVR